MVEPPSDPCAGFAPLLAGRLDGELTAAEDRALTRHLRACVACRGQLAQTQAVRLALRWLGASVVPAPAVARQQRRRRLGAALALRPRFGGALGTVAVALLLVGLVALAWRLPGRGATTLTDRVLVAEGQPGALDRPLALATGEGTAAARWAAAVVGVTPDVPDLTSAGYGLAGVRAEPVVGRTAVTLVYRGPRGTLACVMVPGHGRLVGAAQGVPVVHLVVRGDIAVAGWWDDEATYLLAGRTSAGELRRVAARATRP